MPHVDGVEHRTVDAGGLRVHVAEAGAGEPLLMLHGWPQHWYMWRKVIPLVTAAGNRVICPDLRGHGWTEAPPGRYAKETLASDLLALLDALELERVRMIGHDWGAFAGFLACLRAPARFEALVSLQIPSPHQRPSASGLLESRKFWYQAVLGTPVLGAWVMGSHPQLIARFMRRDAHNPDTWTDEELASFTAQWQDPERVAAHTRLYRTMVTREVPAIVRGRYRGTRLKVPALILYGEDDMAVGPSLFRGLERYADDLRIERVPDCGHFIAEEQPELVARRALEFFAAKA